MTDEQADKPESLGRTVLRAASWSGAIVLVLLLCWFVGARVVPFCQARAVVRAYPATASRQTVDFIGQLGGSHRAAHKLGLYLRAPRFLTPDRWAAIDLLADCGKPAIPVLVEALGHPDEECRAAAMLELQGFREDAVPCLVDRIGDDDKYCDLEFLLVGFTAEAMPLLIPKLKDENWKVRRNACCLLGNVTKDSAAVPALVEALHDDHPIVRMQALFSLEYITGIEYPHEVEMCPKCKAFCGPIPCTKTSQEAAARFWRKWLADEAPGGKPFARETKQ